MMELFDKKFVHFIWDDELEGKKGFLSSGIDTLIKMVNEGSDRTEIQKGCERDLPFCKHITVECRLAYYDPNYEAKKAFNEGKKIQVRCSPVDTWTDCVVSPEWNDECEYRMKPDREKWIAYLARPKNGNCYLTACREDRWESVQKDYDAKTKLFVGSGDEVVEWYKPRRKFAPIIKAWEDGKTIQFRHIETEPWLVTDKPLWYDDSEYRIAPEEKKYRPYVSSAEMIADFIDRFKVKCPPYAEPLIWVGLKQQDCWFLITGIFSYSVKINGTLCMLENLFNCYTYRDGSPCGMEVK